MSTVSYPGARWATRSLRLAAAGLLGLTVIALPGAASPQQAAAVPGVIAVPVNQAASSAAAVAPRADGSQLVVYRGEDDAAYYRTFTNGTWSAEGGLSGVLVGPPAVTATDPSSHVVAARGWDGALWLKTSSAGTWGGWQSLGGVLSAGPAIVGAPDGRLDVFVRGNTNVLYTRTRLPGATWGPWRSLSGVLTSAPTAVALGPGRIDVYVTGWDYAIWRISLSGGVWSSWTSLGGRTYNAPAATRVPGTAGPMVFARGVDNALWVNQNPTGSWTGWSSLGGLLIDAPAAATTPTGDVDVIVRGRDNALWSRSLRAGTWTPWLRGWIPAAPTPPAAGLRGVDWTRIPTTSNVIALTFDAGGNARGLPSIRSTLQTKNVPATFYLTGNWTRSFPADANLIANSGFLVGNHSDTHPHFPALTDAQVRAEVLNAQQAVLYANGSETRPLFRFPYGDVNSRVLADVNALNYVAVRWTVDSLGWQGTSGGQTTDKVVARVLAGARPGAIVLMHIGSNPTDGTTLDASALPRIIDSLRARGYRFVTLDALTG